ncbi:MAG: BLUF domain-containing protein, partial [Oceanicaulis sp.]
PLRDIAMKSLDRNAERGVTGVLCIERNAFVQVLEGDRAALDDIFGDIKSDQRHFALELVVFEPASERLFADWAVAFAIPVRLPIEHRRNTDVYAMSALHLIERAQVLRATGVAGERALPRGGAAVAPKRATA